MPIYLSRKLFNPRIDEYFNSLWLIDAFTSDPFSGNPAGVCLVKDFPKTELMQKIAFELYWSETVFIKYLDNTNYHIRWFSPKDEAPICGHATLACAHFLWESGIVTSNEITFKSLAGGLPVALENHSNEKWITMDFPVYEIKKCDLNISNETFLKISEALNDVEINEIWRDKLLYIVIVNSEEDVANCAPNLELIKTLDCRALVITAKSDKQETDFVSRYFAPKVGINEDPVCGSAHCRLAPFWAKRLNKKDLIARQLSFRGGVLRLKCDDNYVKISGQAKTIMKGKLELL